MKFKKGIIILSLLFICMSIHATLAEPVAAATVTVQDSYYYNGGTSSLSDQIQAILDKANPGDTIKFLGQLYENLQLTINKKLNIITSTGTKITGSNSPDSAVFLINGLQASGTNISGFNITGSGIVVNNTSTVTLSKNNISAVNGPGINVSSSKNIKITGSTISDVQNGINVENSANTTLDQDQIRNNAKQGVGIYNSSNTNINNSNLTGNGNNNSAGVSPEESAVYVQGSDKVKISNSQIKENSQGISTNDASNVTVNSNKIFNNYGEGISLSGSARNITIENNDIEGNNNGIKINYNSCKDINIHGNLVTGSVARLTAIEDSGNGFLYGSSYSRSVTESIEHNVIYGNSHFETRACTAPVSPLFGSNWFGDAQLLCPAIDYAAPIKMEIVRTGQNSYIVRFYDGVTGELVTDLWSIPVTFTAGSFSQTVMTQNGEATIQVNPVPITDKLNASTDGISVSTPWNSQIEDHEAPTVTGKPVYNIPKQTITVNLSEPVKAGNYWIELKDNNGKAVSSTKSIDSNIITLKLSNILTTGKYTLIIHTSSLTDLAGNNVSLYTNTFTVDATAPTVKTIDPTNKATNIATNKVIKVTFNESIKAGSNYWIELKDNTGKAVNFTKSINGNTLTITPKSALVKGTKYTVILHTGSITDLSRNNISLVTSSFTTDGTAPTIKTIDPTNKATNIAIDKIIKITFNESIKAGNYWIELKDNTGKAVNFTKSINGNTLTITPSALVKGTKYTLILHTGSITDLSRNNISLVTSSFTTDGTSPTVKSVDPINKSTSVAVNKIIKVTFSESIKAGNYWIELKDNNGKAVSFTKSISGNILTITPSALVKGTKYTVILHTGSITDLSGNKLTLNTSTFTVLK